MILLRPGAAGGVVHPRGYGDGMRVLVSRTPLAGWTARRWVATVVVLPVLLAWFGSAAGAGELLAAGAGLPLGWAGLVLLTSLAGALVLASYVPAVGSRPDLGCTTCAALSAVTVLAATLVLRNGAAGDGGTAALALAVVGFGLAQRLSDPAACGVPAGAVPGVGEASHPPVTRSSATDAPPSTTSS